MTAQRVCSAVGLLAALLLAGCSTPATRVILLPQADGTPSSVVVRSNNDAEQVLNQPYQRASVGRGAPAVDQADDRELRAANPLLFSMMPPPVQRYTVYFEPGGAVLTASSRITMESALRLAVVRSGSEIVLTGHTDTVGSGAANDDLSRRRAQQVRDLFVARRFPAERIEVVGRGERDPDVATRDEVDEPRNRRVTIEVR